MRRHEPSDKERAVIPPPRTSRGVPRGDDRRAIDGILRRFRGGTPLAGSA